MGYEPAIAATRAEVRDRVVYLTLADGSTHSFLTLYYPRLADAPDDLLQKVTLRVDGKALHWEELDEDIWVGHAVIGNYPRRRPETTFAPSTPHPIQEHHA
jgi:Protein of unknown function (DUF2442)